MNITFLVCLLCRLKSQSTQESKYIYDGASGPKEQTYEDLKNTSENIVMQDNATYTELNKATQYETLNLGTLHKDNAVYCELNVAT